MTKVKVKEFTREYLSEINEPQIALYTVQEHKDIEGVKYTTLKEQRTYCKVCSMFGVFLYVEKRSLLRAVIEKDLEPLIDNSIYEHGYPESRLIPSDHYSNCLTVFTEDLTENIKDMIVDIIHDHTGDFDYES
jgi:hypothetical protein